MNTKLLRKAFTTGYTDDQYMGVLKEFFARKEVYESGLELIDYEDSIFYFKKDSKNGKGDTRAS